jgi:hypothetical protein
MRRSNRYILGTLLGLLALNAFTGGYHAMRGAPGVPVEWLEGSALSSYFIPGLILFVIVGGAAAAAAVAVFIKHHRALGFAKLAGWILVVWLIEQLVIIGFVSWLQPATAAVAAAILVLAYRGEQLRPRWREV